MAAARKALVRRAERAFATVNTDVLPQNFNAELIAPKWNWPSGESTERKNSEVVTSPRNVVDEGGLFDSYYRRRDGPGRFVHGWSAPYAALAHNGGVLKTGGTIFPRPWTELPLEFLPQEFAKAFRDGA